MRTDLSYLITNYQNKLKLKVERLTPRASASPSKNMTRSQSKTKDFFNKFVPGDLDAISNMDYLRKIAPRATIDVVLDPKATFHTTRARPFNFKLNLQTKLQKIQPACVISTRSKDNAEEMKSDKGSLGRSDLKLSRLSLMFNIANSKIKDIKKVSILLQRQSKENEMNGDGKIFKTQHSRDSKESEESDNARANSVLSDGEAGRDSLDRKDGVLGGFKTLPDVFKEYPRDVDPLGFFRLHSHTLKAFNDYINPVNNLSSTLMLHKTTNDDGLVYTSMAIEITDLMSRTSRIYLPFCIAYFLACTPRIVQLCLINKYILNFIKSNSPFSDSVNVQMFLDTLGDLTGHEQYKNPRVSIQGNLRISLFGNAKLNSVFGKNESELHKGSQYVINAVSKLSDRGSNNSHYGMELLNKNKQHEQTATAHRDVDPTGAFGKIKIDIKNRSERQAQNGMSSLLKQRETHEFVKTKETVVETQQQNLIKSHKKGEDQLQISLVQENSDLDDQSESGKSGLSGSINEELYSSNNPYEIQYSKVAYKFKSYTINIVKPRIWDANGSTIKNMDASDILHVLNIDRNQSIGFSGSRVDH